MSFMSVQTTLVPVSLPDFIEGHALGAFGTESLVVIPPLVYPIDC